MSYLPAGPPQSVEPWELEEGQFISTIFAGLSRRRRIAILLSVGMVTAIEISNRLSVNVFLPDMQGNVGASSDEISWVIILYNVGFLCSLAVAAWMTRVVGTRRHLLISIGLYAGGAMGCVLSSHSLQQLLVSRLIMGFGGGAFLVRVVILAGLMFPGKARLAAVTWLYFVLAIFEVPYPVVMGWITDQLHWNYAFLLDFPFLAIGALLIWKLVPPGYLMQWKKSVRVDVWGAVLLIVSLACLETATSRGERDLWFESTWITVALLGAIVFFIAFLWWDYRLENASPVLHLRMIWRQPLLRAFFVVILIVGAFFGAGLYVVPQYLRFVQGYSATQAGGFVSMYTLGLGLGLQLTVHVFLARLGGVRTLVIGLVLLLATYLAIVYIWTPTSPTIVLAPAIFLQGFCLAPVLLAAGNIVTSNASIGDVNDVSTTYFFVRQLGNTLGVTAATIMFDRRMTLHSERLLDTANRLDATTHFTLTQYAHLIQRSLGGSSDPRLGALQLFQANVITQSRLLSYIDIYFGLAVLAVVALLSLALGRIRHKTGRHHFLPW
ncbi:MAG TPA: MFS transporter [Candidatus Acidoferrales bacterium]|jgi:DHA2 family multidrug resistance protein|nr:MFS transporter [Candidatus Acidoferrales bacterium]